MSFFERRRQRREMEKLEQEMASAPTPATVIRLSEIHVAFGELDRALAVARQGINLLPGSERIQTTYKKLRKIASREQIQNLKREIDRHPTPTHFVELAEIYKEIGEEDTCAQICRQCIEEFPDEEGPYLILGLLRKRRFERDRLALDGKAALDHFEKACLLNERNYRALLEQARIYLQINAVENASDKLKEVLAFAPEDATVRELLDQVRAMPRPRREIVDELLKEAESEHLRAARGAGPAAIVPARLQKHLGIFTSLKGFKGVLVKEPRQRTLAVRIENGFTQEKLNELVEAVCHTSHNSAKRMDIGHFVGGQIQGPFGQIHVASLANLYIGVFCGNEKPENVREVIERFVAEAIRSEPEDEGQT